MLPTVEELMIRVREGIDRRANQPDQIFLTREEWENPFLRKVFGLPELKNED